jgi:hypothetical protein
MSLYLAGFDAANLMALCGNSKRWCDQEVLKTIQDGDADELTVRQFIEERNQDPSGTYMSLKGDNMRIPLKDIRRTRSRQSSST